MTNASHSLIDTVLNPFFVVLFLFTTSRGFIKVHGYRNHGIGSARINDPNLAIDLIELCLCKRVCVSHIRRNYDYVSVQISAVILTFILLYLHQLKLDDDDDDDEAVACSFQAY